MLVGRSDRSLGTTRRDDRGDSIFRSQRRIEDPVQPRTHNGHEYADHRNYREDNRRHQRERLPARRARTYAGTQPRARQSVAKRGYQANRPADNQACNCRSSSANELEHHLTII